MHEPASVPSHTSPATIMCAESCAAGRDEATTHVIRDLAGLQDPLRPAPAHVDRPRGLVRRGDAMMRISEQEKLVARFGVEKADAAGISPDVRSRSHAGTECRERLAPADQTAIEVGPAGRPTSWKEGMREAPKAVSGMVPRGSREPLAIFGHPIAGSRGSHPNSNVVTPNSFESSIAGSTPVYIGDLEHRSQPECGRQRPRARVGFRDVDKDRFAARSVRGKRLVEVVGNDRLIGDAWPDLPARAAPPHDRIARQPAAVLGDVRPGHRLREPAAKNRVAPFGEDLPVEVADRIERRFAAGTIEAWIAAGSARPW